MPAHVNLELELELELSPAWNSTEAIAASPKALSPAQANLISTSLVSKPLVCCPSKGAGQRSTATLRITPGPFNSRTETLHSSFRDGSVYHVCTCRPTSRAWSRRIQPLPSRSNPSLLVFSLNLAAVCLSRLRLRPRLLTTHHAQTSRCFLHLRTAQAARPWRPGVDGANATPAVTPA